MPDASTPPFQRGYMTTFMAGRPRRLFRFEVILRQWERSQDSARKKAVEWCYLVRGTGILVSQLSRAAHFGKLC